MTTAKVTRTKMTQKSTRQTISSLETGRYNPSITLAYQVAKFFGMTIEEVFIFEEDAK